RGPHRRARHARRADRARRPLLASRPGAGDRGRAAARGAGMSAAAFQEEEALGKAYDARLLGRLWRYVAPYRLQVLATILVTIPSFGLELGPAWIIKNGLDRLDPNASAHAPSFGSALLQPPHGISLLGWLAGLYLLAMLTNAALQFANGVLMSLT